LDYPIVLLTMSDRALSTPVCDGLDREVPGTGPQTVDHIGLEADARELYALTQLSASVP